MVCTIEFPLDNPDIINNGLCRFCPFQVPINVDGIKVLQTHYTADHPVSEVKNDDPQMGMIVQKRNNLPDITVGIYDVGKCLQQDCRYTKTDKKNLKAKNLQCPSLKVLQTGKNLKFWKKDHGLEEDDFNLKNNRIYACLDHSVTESIPKSKEENRREQNIRRNLFARFGWFANEMKCFQ